MVILYGAGFVFVAILLVSGGAYLVFADSEPIKSKPEPGRKAIRKAPEWRKNEGGGVIIPSEIPRNVNTIQTMADEDPDIVAEVVKMWLHNKN